MRLADVVEILSDLRAAGCRVWVAGGWGVDALVGRQTRPHRDLDLAVDDEPGHPLPVSLHPVHADDPSPDHTDPDRAAPAAVTARLVKRRRRRDERGEAS